MGRHPSQSWIDISPSPASSSHSHTRLPSLQSLVRRVSGRASVVSFDGGKSVSGESSPSTRPYTLVFNSSSSRRSPRTPPAKNRNMHPAAGHWHTQDRTPPQRAPRWHPSSPLANRPLRLGPREAALVDTLTRSGEAEGVLEEYAWYCLVSGTRVREYNKAAAAALNGSTHRGILQTLENSPIRLLYPCATPCLSLTLPPHTLANLTRRQLVHALVHLASDVEERVLELILEYIGRRWRLDNGDVDGISRKLADVQVEIQGETLGAVLSVFENARVQLGFVTRSFLADWLTSHSVEAAPIRAWAVRRLSAGVEPQAIASEAGLLRDCLGSPARELVTKVLSSLCLDDRSGPDAERPLPVRTRTLSRISLRAKRKTLPLPQWFSPRNGPSRLAAAEERRPSLPTLTPDGPSRVRTPTTPHSASPCSTPSRSPLAGTPPEVVSVANTLGLSTEPYTRTQLVDHLLTLRYRLGLDADAWYLGNGQDKATSYLDGVESVCPSLKFTIVQLRDAFCLSPGDNTPTASNYHVRDVSFDLDQYIADIGPMEDDSTSSTTSSQPLLLPQRGSLASIASLNSALTDITRTTGSRQSVISAFSICEATRVPVTLSSYQFPMKHSATDDLVVPRTVPVPEYPRFAQSLPNVGDVYTRLPERLLRRRRAYAERDLVQHWDSSTSSPSSDSTLSPRPAVDNGRRSRGKMYRQCVIVDGAHVSPRQTICTEETTALGVILNLFAGGRNPSAEEVERRLTEAVHAEASRAAARGDEFDAEARARLAWLLEQIGHELAQPHLISAVDRVLQSIASPTSSPQATPHPFRAARNLSITVPPRLHYGLQLVTSPSSPRSNYTFSSPFDSPVRECHPFPVHDSTTPVSTPPLHRRSAFRHAPDDRVQLPSLPGPLSPQLTPTASLVHAL